jgi:hypothetical protein
MSFFSHSFSLFIFLSLALSLSVSFFISHSLIFSHAFLVLQERTKASRKKLHFLLLDQEKEKGPKLTMTHLQKTDPKKTNNAFQTNKKKIKMLFKKFFSFCSDDLHNKPPYSK